MKRTRHLITAIAALSFTAATSMVQAQADPPPNDHCEDISPLALAVNSTVVFTGNNEGATFDGDNVPGSGLSGFGQPVVWVAFTTTECSDITISYCGSTAPFFTDYFWDAITKQCPADELIGATGYNNNECSDGQPVIHFNELPAGTYYHPVWSDPNDAIGDYVISISATACEAQGVVANAGPDQQLCTPVTSTTVAANVPEAPATGIWSVVSGSFTIVDPSDPNTQFMDLSVGANIAAWTVDDGAGDTASDEVAIYVYDDNNPEAGAGPDQELCDPSTTLAGSSLLYPATGTWTLVSGAGIINDPSASSTDVTDLAPGENVFQWTVNNGPCANGITTDLVSIILYDATSIVDAGPDQQLEFPTTTTTMAGSTPVNPAIGTWSVVAGSGMFTDANSSVTTVTGLSVGENVLMWTINNGPCGMTSDEVTITVSGPGSNIPELLPGDTLDLSGNNEGAVDSVGLGFPSAWEAFTLTECANVVVDYCSTDGFTLFASGLYSGSPGGALIPADSSLACANDAPIEYFSALQPGTYWIAVQMDPDLAMGDYSITVAATACTPEVPANDQCAEAITITVVAPDSCATGVVLGDNSNATGSGDMPACADPDQNWQDVWYTFNTGGADEVTISLVPGSIDGAGMEVFAACGDSSFACSIDGAQIELTQLTDPVYHVRVFTQEDGTPGTFALCVTSDNTTGVSNMDRGTVQLYPNPGTGDFTFVPSVSWTDARITVLDMTGRTVHVAQTDLRAGEAYPLFLAGTLKAGSYLFHVSSTEGSSMVKLMVK